MTTGNAFGTPFGDRVRQSVADRGHLCVGIDPHPQLLAQWGLPNDAVGLREFSQRVLAGCGRLAAAIKPQIAFFEAHGASGMAVLEQVLWEARDTGALVVADAKRGDIGSTLAAYAQGWLAPGAPFYCDAVTLSPYLGVGALEPAFAAAEESGRGVYVLAATSNPEAVALQRSCFAEEPVTTVAQHVADEVAARNEAVRGGADPSFGLVIGATVQEPPKLQVSAGPLLVPGFGAQGGTAADVRRVVGPCTDVTVVNVSRQILAAGPDPQALEKASADVVKQLENL